ncbi:MAG: methionine--tRNA ligase [Candidatus Marinimicrobia bacterium]|nr:methionine--tRNA ligase [Candidatus Neomarinimicrobiota bacterium]
MSKFYITTPLYYVNDEPHIGHAYTTILADVISRIKKKQNNDVFFLTGTDEHGQKVQEAAEKRNVSPKEHVDEYVTRFKNTWKKLNIDYDYFIRTTDENHKNRVKEILNNLYKTGEIYFDEYEGLYSVSEERFITEKEMEEGSFREIKKIKEKNYFFKMSKYKSKIIKHIESNENFILPKSRRNEILGFLKNDLNDLCISRPKSRLSWGIELPFNKDYVTYVWFDALINYISAIGYNRDHKKFNYYWPADYHLMAKDILTTHCVYWPTMLMACNITLPKTIFAHGWWLMNDTKMSKSIGNVIKPLELADKYGSDALRYYLMRNMVLGQDSSFTISSFNERYNSDLANDYGNLVNRIFILISKNFNNMIPTKGELDLIDNQLINNVEKSRDLALSNYNKLKIHDGIENSISIFRLINKFLEDKAPWKTIKKDKILAGTTIYLSAEALRIGTILLYPIIPEKSKLILDSIESSHKDKITFGELKENLTIKIIKNIFPRIEN